MRYNSCIKNKWTLLLMEEREKATQQGDRWPERLAYEREREPPSKGEKIARKAERENIALDPDRGGGCPWKQLTQKRKNCSCRKAKREMMR